MALHNQSVAAALQEHLDVCGDLLRLSQKESDALRDPVPFPARAIQAERKVLLARLESSSLSVARERGRWQQRKGPAGETHPELATLAQRALDTIMRVLVLDRENEKSLLCRGLLPARSLPRAEQSQPHFVAQTYQRHVRN